MALGSTSLTTPSTSTASSFIRSFVLCVNGLLSQPLADEVPGGTRAPIHAAGAPAPARGVGRLGLVRHLAKRRGGLERRRAALIGREPGPLDHEQVSVRDAAKASAEPRETGGVGAAPRDDAIRKGRQLDDRVAALRP